MGGKLIIYDSDGTRGNDYSWLSAQTQTGSYQYPYGCPVEPAEGPAYPDLLAEMLGPPYSEGYTVAAAGDYRAGNPNQSDAEFNRVGVWGYKASDALTAYREAESRGIDTRDGTEWESQLHALQGARDMATVSFGANDIGFSDYWYWIPAYFQDPVGKTALEEAARVRYEGGEFGGQEYPGTEQALDELFREHLGPASDGGTEVLVTLYPNVVSDNPTCVGTYDIADEIVNTLDSVW